MALSPIKTPASTTIDAYRAWALVSLLRLRWFIHLRWVFGKGQEERLSLRRLRIARPPFDLSLDKPSLVAKEKGIASNGSKQSLQ